MATIVNSDVRASGGDYATITLWEASLGDLVAADEQHNGLLFNEQYDENVVFAGATTDATRFARLAPAVGEQTNVRVAGSGPRVQPTTTGAADNIFDIQDAYYRFEDFEIFGDVSNGTTVATAIMNVPGAGGDGLHILRMLLHRARTTISRNAGINVVACDGAVISGNFIYDLALAGSSSRALQLAGTTNAVGTTYVTNNSLLNGSDRGLTLVAGAGSSAFVDKNNIVLAFVGICFGYFAGAGSSIVSDRNMSSDTTAADNGDGTHYINESAAAIYVNSGAGTENLHLQTGTNAIGNGEDLGASPVGVENDIDGYDRNAGGDAWDIGGDQQGKNVTDNGSVGDITVNPGGSALSLLASGLVGFSTVLSPLAPSGSTLSTLASGAPAITAEEVIVLNPVGSTLPTLASGTVGLQIDSVISTSPTGDSLGALETRDTPVDLRHPLTITLDQEGSTLQTIASGTPQITGIAQDIILDLAFLGDTGSTLLPLESGVPTLLPVNVGNVSVVPFGSTLQPLAFSNNLVPSIIDTDINLVVVGSALPTLSGSGSPSIVVQATGVTLTLGVGDGSTLLLLASGTTQITSSHPTAPPGTAGGRLIIRSITRNVTRPVTHTPIVAVQAFNA